MLRFEADGFEVSGEISGGRWDAGLRARREAQVMKMWESSVQTQPTKMWVCVKAGSRQCCGGGGGGCACDRDADAAGESREAAVSSSQGEKCVRKRKWLAGSGLVHRPCGMWSSKCPLDLATRKSEEAVRGWPQGSGGPKPD